MSDKDDLFAADDDFAALEEDDFFADEPAEPKKVTKPAAMAKEEVAPEEPKVEETETEEPVEVEAQVETAEVKDDDDEDPLQAEPKAEEPEVKAEEPKPEKKAAPKKAAPKADAPKKGKRAVKPLTAKQKAVNNILRKAGLEEEIPTLGHLLRGKQGTKVKISDIAVFIKEPEDEVLADLFKDMSVLNRVNLSACVDINRVKVVGGQVLGAGRMYQPIQVGKIEEDGRLECTSGRHRLALLALLYGTDIEIPVYIEDMDINEARDAVVFANMARKAKAMEQAEHAVLAAVGGDVDADQDEIYAKTVTTKAKAKKYCTYSVLERGKPVKLSFPLGGKKEGGLATIGTIEGFWLSAIDWNKSMTRKEFDSGLKGATEFVNNLVNEFKGNESFDASQHMATMTMKAIGKYYKTMSDANVDMDDAFMTKLVNVVVAMGEIGRQKSEETYAAIVKAMK